MDTGEDLSRLLVRTGYDPDYGQVLYDILLRRRSEYGGPTSKFFMREVIGTVRPNAHRVFDELGNSLKDAIVPEITQANLKAIQRYYGEKGKSDNQTLIRLVHAYLQIKAGGALAKISPFKTAHAVGRMIGDFLIGDVEREITFNARKDQNSILAAFSYKDELYDLRPRFLVFLPGMTSSYVFCLSIRPPDSFSSEESTHLGAQYGFCTVEEGWPLLVLRDIHDGERNLKGLLVLSDDAPFAQSVAYTLDMEVYVSRNAQRSIFSHFVAKREQEPRIIKDLQKIIVKMRLEHL